MNLIPNFLYNLWLLFTLVCIGGGMVIFLFFVFTPPKSCGCFTFLLHHTRRQLPPINSLNIEFFGTSSLLTPRK